MIRLKSIKKNDNIVSCLAFVEDCETAVAVSYDVEKDVLLHKELPFDYFWCDRHFDYAKKELKKMVDSGDIRDHATIMWY